MPESLLRSSTLLFETSASTRFAVWAEGDPVGNYFMLKVHLVENSDFTLCKFSASYLAARVPEFALLDHEGQIEQSRDEDAAKFARKT